MVTAASAAAEKLSYSTLKAKQMNVVMDIMSKRNVFTTLIMRCGKSLCYGHLPYTYDEALFIFSITNVWYRVTPTKTQRIFSSHCCTCIIMCITPTTVMQLSSSLEIPMAQVVDAFSPDPFPIFEGGVRQHQTIY